MMTHSHTEAKNNFL